MTGLTLFYLDYSLLSLSHFSSLISCSPALQPSHSASSFYTPVLQTNLSYICHKGPFIDLPVHLTLFQIMKSPILFSSLNSLVLWLYDPDLSHQQLSCHQLFCCPVIYLSPEPFYGLTSFIHCYNFSYSELWLFHIYSSSRSSRSWLNLYDILTPSSVSFTALYCGAQSAQSPFRLFFSWLLSFTDRDTLCLTHNP